MHEGTMVPPLPKALQMEITSACNLRCAMCLVRYRPPVNKLTGAMPLDLFRRILDQVPALRQLTLQGLGEPLLCPDLLSMIRLATHRRIRVGFNSNATLLSGRMAHDLVAAGLDWLHVSLDGADASTFESIREGGDFARVLRNLAGLLDAKRSAGSSTPWVRVVFVAMRRNVDELPDLIRLVSDLGVDEVRVQNLSHSFSDTDPGGRYQEIRDYVADQALWTGADRARTAAVYAEVARAAAQAKVRVRLPANEPAAGQGCTWPWDSAYITSTGLVQPCCMVMGDDRVCLGDLNQATFSEIWASPAYREFRRRMRSDDPPEVCRGCALYHGTF
jgi:radical SAM protein with 4Fe4S-binding SPASM domain